jgi:hydroxyacyl-ACP dehydratase HTD2-like protein with hotdog domain
MPTVSQLEIGQTLPQRSFAPTNVSLFLYNAAIWNPHRIHYDERYVTEVEHHPGIVIDGPLQGDWLTQAVLEWLGDSGTFVEFEYSNRKASYLGDHLYSGGTIASIDEDAGLVTLDLFIKDERGEITTPGRAVVRLQA